MQKVANIYVPAFEETRLDRCPRFGYFRVNWTETGPSGRARTKTISCKTKDRKTAEAFRRNFCIGGEHLKQRLEAVTLDELCKHYLENHVEANGLTDTNRTALIPIRNEWGQRPFSDVDHADVMAYRRKRAKEGISDGTVRRELSAFSTVLRWCERNQIIDKGRALEHVALPADNPARDVWLNEKEEAALFHAALNELDGERLSRIGRFVCIALCTAARARSIETLRWEQVDLVRRTIDFRPKGTRVTKKRRVMLPISDRLLPILQRAYDERESDVYVMDMDGSVRKAWETFRAKQGYDDLRRHDLRRTWATLAARAGVDLFQIAGVLGDTMETVMRHYAVHSPDHLRGAVNARGN